MHFRPTCPGPTRRVKPSATRWHVLAQARAHVAVTTGTRRRSFQSAFVGNSLPKGSRLGPWRPPQLKMTHYRGVGHSAVPSTAWGRAVGAAPGWARGDLRWPDKACIRGRCMRVQGVARGGDATPRSGTRGASAAVGLGAPRGVRLRRPAGRSPPARRGRPPARGVAPQSCSSDCPPGPRAHG